MDPYRFERFGAATRRPGVLQKEAALSLMCGFIVGATHLLQDPRSTHIGNDLTRVVELSELCTWAPMGSGYLHLPDLLVLVVLVFHIAAEV